MTEKTRSSTSNERSSHTSDRERAGSTAFEEPSRFGAGLFEQAMDTYEQTLRAGLRLQEESARWWTSLLNEKGTPNSWGKASEVFNNIPAAQRRWLDDTMRLLDQNSRRSLELLRKAGETAGAMTPGEAQAKLQRLWEESLQLLRSNTEAMTAANQRVMDAWVDLVRRGAEVAGNGADRT